MTARKRRSSAPFGTLGFESFEVESFGFEMPGLRRLTRWRKRARLPFFPSVLLSPASPGAFLPSGSPTSLVGWLSSEPPLMSLTKCRLYPARSLRAPRPCHGGVGLMAIRVIEDARALPLDGNAAAAEEPLARTAGEGGGEGAPGG